MNLSSPYKGLAAFDDSEVDALLFFGRERDTEIVVANLIASRLTVLYGPSGVGKSSLLLASVARALRALPEKPLVVIFSNWSEDPERALATAVAARAGLAAGALIDVVEQAQATRDVYVILDQAEEYFTYHGDPKGFESVLAELVNGPLRVNVLVALREDALASLDRLKAAIPTMFGNVLRLDRLDRAAGAAAIVRPIERWNELEGGGVVAEAALVEAVLDGVGTGRVELGPGAAGSPTSNGGSRGIEAPYLQLVMQRLWEVERERGSDTMRVSTLEHLGGARRIVAHHLERAMSRLDPRAQDLAAVVFGALVTASGAKIAHDGHDLADYAEAPAATLLPVLDSLAEGRILRRDEHGRYEIFHDVLAAEILDWRRRHLTELALERERQAARRKQRRLGLVVALALAGITLTAGLAIWALSERGEANEQAAAARQAESSAEEQAALARNAEKRSRRQAVRARRAEQRARRQTQAAQLAQAQAQDAQASAEASAQAASAAQQQALGQAAIARRERDRADQQADAALAATERANASTIVARQALGAARRSGQQERRARVSADRATMAARAGERLAAAQALLTTTPEAALQAALDSLQLDPARLSSPFFARDSFVHVSSTSCRAGEARSWGRLRTAVSPGCKHSGRLTGLPATRSSRSFEVVSCASSTAMTAASSERSGAAWR